VTLREAQRELRRHTWDNFVLNPPAVALGGEGVVVPGCPSCRKRINTLSEYMDHLADDVLPVLITAVSERIVNP
jgi:hypothetical protein